MFLSTPPSRVATAFNNVHSSFDKVSIHATLAGGDSDSAGVRNQRICFYPRHPRGWRRNSLFGNRSVNVFLSTPPSRVATKKLIRLPTSLSGFYPRHPRGWRRQRAASGRCVCLVSIHATLAGGDAGTKTFLKCSEAFLSTPPSRVATGKQYTIIGITHVSIHATLAGGDNQSAFA